MRTIRTGLRALSLLVIAVAVAVPAHAQPARGARGGANAGGGDKGPKPYDEVITEEAESRAGLFITHRVGDKLYYEIPTDALDIDMVWVTTLEQTQAGYSWAGMPVNDRVVRWEQRGERVLLRDIKYSIRANVDDPITKAVEETSMPVIIKAFDVAAWGKDKAPVIDVSELFTKDQSEFSAKESLGMGGLDSSRTFIEQVKAFPINIEVKVLATYTPQRQGANGRGGRGFPSSIPRDSSQSGLTVMLHHSMVRLPENPMKPRVWDDRVGFFTTRFTDYGDDSEHEAPEVRYITRWRLEKKDPDAEMSDPVKPIVWYVAREVPAKWQEYVLKGIEDWQPAFEAAGFTNAIVGKLAPDPREDPDWDAEDARYTTIRWLPSAVPNAFGPNVHDPRTGEILEADVRMFHNVMRLVRDWYFVQAGASDERAQKLPMPDDLMGELIRFVVAHEVGHSLGFPHNMKASSTYTVEQLRDAEFTRTMGTAPSIMDYARFNYVAQPGDGASLLPGVGVYDKFATNWGYRQYASNEDEQEGLAKLFDEQIENPMYRFGNPNAREDPTQQTEDLTGDPVGATRMGLMNLERIVGFLVEATSDEDEDYHILEHMHGQLLGQWAREMGHVVSVVGGFERINLYYGDAEQRFFSVDADRQREAIEFLNEHAFDNTSMFFAPDITLRIEASGVADRVAQAQGRLLRSLIADQRIKRMSEHAQRDGDDTYTPSDMLGELREGIWSELDGRVRDVTLPRRNVQRAHVDTLIQRMTPDEDAPSSPFGGGGGGDPVVSDLPALARAELAAILEMCEDALERTSDDMTRAHLMDVAAKIRLAFDD
ncbi:MAG: zinc-dependent metalloprotease [Phycisphaerales bacterium JB043]